MNGKEILEGITNGKITIPSKESIIIFAREKGLEIFREGRGFNYSHKVGLVLDLDVEKPGIIKEYFLDDGKGNLYKMDNESISVKKGFDLIIDPVIGNSLTDKVNEFKLKITSNSIYDEVIATINGIGIDMTDYNNI